MRQCGICVEMSQQHQEKSPNELLTPNTLGETFGIGTKKGCFLRNSAHNAIIMNKSRHSHEKTFKIVANANAIFQYPAPKNGLHVAPREFFQNRVSC